MSDAFSGDDGCLECKAIMYNINYGHNTELLKQCRILEEYAIFIDTIRKYQKTGEPLKMAVELAVDECINNNVLRV